MVIAGFVGLLALDPIPQDPNYHLFADTRSLFGIPNFFNVLSNIGFAVVGVLVMLAVVGRKRRDIFLK